MNIDKFKEAINKTLNLELYFYFFHLFIILTLLNEKGD